MRFKSYSVYYKNGKKKLSLRYLPTVLDPHPEEEKKLEIFLTQETTRDGKIHFVPSAKMAYGGKSFSIESDGSAGSVTEDAKA